MSMGQQNCLRKGPPVASWASWWLSIWSARVQQNLSIKMASCDGVQLPRRFETDSLAMWLTKRIALVTQELPDGRTMPG